MTHLGWLCALAWACLPLHAAAQSGEVVHMGEVAMQAEPVSAVQHIGEPMPSPDVRADGQQASQPQPEPLDDAMAEPAVAQDEGPNMGRGLKPQGTQPAHWPDDLTLSPDRPDPMGLRATPDALPGPTSGLASWYSDRFQGRRTASGEPYSRFEMTAAHRDLPLGSLVHVSNPETGVGVVVRVNDRGPFHGDRIIDLSRAAATVLGLVGLGVGHVDIRLPSSDEAAEFARQLAEAAKRPTKPAQTPRPVPGRAAGATR